MQLHAMRNEISDLTVFDKVTKAFDGLEIEKVVGKDNYIRYRLSGFATRNQARQALKRVRELGWKDAFIVSDHTSLSLH